MSRHLVLTVLLAFALGLVLAVPWARAQNTVLSVTQDGPSLARQIEGYLKSAHKMTIDEIPSKTAPGEIFLGVPYSAGKAPAFTIVLDTTQAVQDPTTKKVVSRVIWFDLVTDVKLDPAQRAAELEAINKWSTDQLFSGAFLDDNNKVRLYLSLNVLPEGLPAEMVYDSLNHLVWGWDDLYAAVEQMVAK
jgi:hypothetical protein